jgi:hypothetical protein
VLDDVLILSPTRMVNLRYELTWATSKKFRFEAKRAAWSAGSRRKDSCAAQKLQLNHIQLPLRFSGIRADRRPVRDFSRFKTSPVSERVKVQFRAGIYNTFNQPSFAAPNRNPNSGVFFTVPDTQPEAKNWRFSLFVEF